MNWDDLKERHEKQGIVLVLGAGVSIGSGIPAWDRLLQRISDQHQLGLNVDDLREHLTLPAIASLIETRFADREPFIEAIRDALYQDFTYYGEGINKSNRRGLVRLVSDENLTLRAVAALCAVDRPDARTFLPSPHIRAVVTFNLDGLLQSYVNARYEQRLLRTVERPSAERIDSKINIYHMHGYLHFGTGRGDTSREAADSIVFTEQNYFDFFNQPNSMFNYTFLYLLREYSCLFIGLSMRDDNIRRLLHYARSDYVNALHSQQHDQQEILKRSKRHFALLKRYPDRAIDEAVEATLLRLGVTVEWVEHFREIPERLRTLHNPETWQRVY